MPRFKLERDQHNRLGLVDPVTGQNPLTIDFTRGDILRRLFKGGKKELLIKAMGTESGGGVWDATAGLGMDAMLLAVNGFEVTLFERSPVIHLLLSQALALAAEHEQLRDAASRMTLVQGDVRDYLSKKPTSPGGTPRIIYLDPMFPARKKTARVNGPMQYLQRFIGPEADSRALVQDVLASDCERVVLKFAARETHNFGTPSHSYAAKANRFDVFVRPPRLLG